MNPAQLLVYGFAPGAERIGRDRFHPTVRAAVSASADG
jgi:hypothetical protein